MGPLIFVAILLVGLPLLPDIVFLLIELVRWIFGRPVRDDDSDETRVDVTTPPRCPSCMGAASDPDAKYCPRCGAGKKRDIQLFEVPAGTAHAEYTVQGQRCSRVGKVSETYVMHIGALGPRLADISAA